MYGWKNKDAQANTHLTKTLQALSDAFLMVDNIISLKNLGDEGNIGIFDDAQQAALCALLPKFTQAGNYAIDGLLKLPTFHNEAGPAFDADSNWGLQLTGSPLI